MLALRDAMDSLRRAKADEEPMGIIISGGNRTEETPRFSAYVWGPVPVNEEEEAEVNGKLVA